MTDQNPQVPTEQPVAQPPAQPMQPVQPPAQPAQPVYQQPAQPVYQQPLQQTPVVTDSGSFGWAVLGFFLPLVGLILFLVWRQTKPKCAKMAGIGAIVGFVFNIILSVISAMFFATIPAYYYY